MTIPEILAIAMRHDTQLARAMVAACEAAGFSTTGGVPGRGGARKRSRREVRQAERARMEGWFDAFLNKDEPWHGR